MNRTLLNAGLAVAVVGLGAAVWFGGKKAEEKKPPLTTLKPAEVERIAIEHPGAPTIRLAKVKDVWMLTGPVQAEADGFEVAGITALAETGLQVKIDHGDAHELGFDAPPVHADPANPANPLAAPTPVPAASTYTLTLNDHRIEFGGEEPLKYRRYVRVDGRQLAVIDEPASAAALDRDYSDLVSKNLLPPGADVTRIKAPGLSIEKTAGGIWSAPEQPQARAEQLQAIVEAWKGAKSMWNAAGEPTDAQGEPVTITLADGRTLGFTLVAREPQLILARPDLGVRYQLAKPDADRLLKLAEPATAAPAPAANGAPTGVDAPLPATTPSPQPTATPPPESQTP